MVTYFGPGADNLVTFSTGLDNPNTDGFDCGSVYGDTAMIVTQSELIAAYAGGLIGIPMNLDNSGGLACGGSPGGMFTFPVSYSQPTLNDIHAHICIPNGSGGCILPAPGDTGSTFGSATARNLYNDIWAFFVYRGFTTHKAMMGEVNHTQEATCGGPNKSMAYANVNGFNGYTGTSSTLYQNAASNTVLRVWANLQDGCYVMPNTISPPYSP
jgi:hypothetical protein